MLVLSFTMITLGNLIKQKHKECGLTVSEFARRLNVSRENIYAIFKRKSIDTDLLKRISKVLGYDFFLYFIPEEKMKISLEKHPEYGTTISQPANIQNLQKEIESLNKEINQLKELVKAKDEIINLLKSHKG